MMSLENLHRLGNNRAALCGDPLFDNAASIAASPVEPSCARQLLRRKECIHRRQRQRPPRSCHDHTISPMTTPDTRFIFVPHDISDRNLRSSPRISRTEVCGYRNVRLKPTSAAFSRWWWTTSAISPHLPIRYLGIRRRRLHSLSAQCDRAHGLWTACKFRTENRTGNPRRCV